MAEYIKRTRVMTICERYSNHCFEQNDAHGQNIADGIFDDIVDLPTEDVVPVVRCKDCKNYEYMSCYNRYFCNRFGGYVNENDYCSRCERITNNG